MLWLHLPCECSCFKKNTPVNPPHTHTNSHTHRHPHIRATPVPRQRVTAVMKHCRTDPTRLMRRDTYENKTLYWCERHIKGTKKQLDGNKLENGSLSNAMRLDFGIFGCQKSIPPPLALSETTPTTLFQPLPHPTPPTSPKERGL